MKTVRYYAYCIAIQVGVTSMSYFCSSSKISNFLIGTSSECELIIICLRLCLLFSDKSIPVWVFVCLFVSVQITHQ